MGDTAKSTVATLRIKTDELFDSMSSGAFSLLPSRDRRRLIREVIRLYRSLSPQKRWRTGASAAASMLVLAGGVLHADEPQFSEPQPSQAGLEILLRAPVYSINALADLDDDGDLDFFTWGYSSDADAYELLPAWQENVGGSRNPIFDSPRLLTEFGLSRFDGYERSGFLLHGFADIDSDGDVDAHGLIADLGRNETYLAVVENVGSPRHPHFASSPERLLQLTAQSDNSAAYLIHSRSTMEDIDSDGDLDIFVGTIGQSDPTGEYSIVPRIKFLRNEGSASLPLFRDVIDDPFGIEFPASDETIIGRVDTEDIDGDGDIDILLGCAAEYGYGAFFMYFENIGDEREPRFAEPARNPFGLEQYVDAVYAHPQPVLGDLDDDGDLDLIYGAGFLDYKGEVFYSENLRR